MGNEFAKITAFGQQVNGLLEEGAYVTVVKKTQPVQSFEQAVEWLMERITSRLRNPNVIKGYG